MKGCVNSQENVNPKYPLQTRSKYTSIIVIRLFFTFNIFWLEGEIQICETIQTLQKCIFKWIVLMMHHFAHVYAWTRKETEYGETTNIIITPTGQMVQLCWWKGWVLNVSAYQLPMCLTCNKNKVKFLIILTVLIFSAKATSGYVHLGNFFIDHRIFRPNHFTLNILLITVWNYISFS